MESLKGTQNIVGIEDYKVVNLEDGITWNIFIRTELFENSLKNESFLTSFRIRELPPSLNTGHLMHYALLRCLPGRAFDQIITATLPAKRIRLIHCEVDSPWTTPRIKSPRKNSRIKRIPA